MDDKQAIVVVKNELSWLQRHERMVICALVLIVAMFLGNKYLDSSAEKAKSDAAVAAQLAADAKLAAQQAAEQSALTTAQYQEVVRVQQEQIAVLVSAISQRNAGLATQQTAVKTAPLPEVAKTWQGAIGGDGDIVFSTLGLTVNDSAARRTVSMLLELPVAKANLADETKIAEATQQQLNKSNELTAVLSTQIDKLNDQIAADDKSCKATVASVKADARKSKRNWFVAGVVSGGLLAAKLVLMF